MSKKTYHIKVNDEEENKKAILIEGTIGIIVYAVVLMIAQSLFKGIYIENFFYAIIAAFILNILNYSVKPFLIYMTLPFTVITCGIAYPIVNVIILNICDLLMGSAFNISGFFTSFIIAIFISIMRIILDSIVTSSFRRL